MSAWRPPVGEPSGTQKPSAPAPAPQPDEGTRNYPQPLLTKSLQARNGKNMGHPIPGCDGIPTNAIVHGACKRWWTGNERSHCGGCHLTLSSLSAFDRHRKGGRCNEPSSVGLVARQMPYGLLWGWPGPEGGMAAARRGGETS